MTFYKFIHDTNNHCALKSIINGYLKFAKIPKLNDFSETFALSDGEEIEKSITKVCRDGLSEEERRNFHKQSALINRLDFEGTFNNLMESVKNIGQKAAKDPGKLLNIAIKELPNLLQNENKYIQNEIGVFCVAEKVDVFPMWAHYANNAKGIAIEFENLEELFSGDETGVFNLLKKVDYYPDKRPTVPLAPSDLTELFFSKHADWQYEREWRVILPLSDCEPKAEGDDDDWRLFKMKNPQKYIKRIIVGWNGDYEEIRKVVSELNSNISVVQAKVNNGIIEI